IDVRRRRDTRDDPLVAVGAGDRRQLLARTIRDLHTRTTRERDDLGERAVGTREHGDLVGTASVRAEQLEHGIPAVDTAFGHYRPFGVRRGPAGVSSTSQPSRAISSRISSPRLKSRRARASPRAVSSCWTSAGGPSIAAPWPKRPSTRESWTSSSTPATNAPGVYVPRSRASA